MFGYPANKDKRCFFSLAATLLAFGALLPRRNSHWQHMQLLQSIPDLAIICCCITPLLGKCFNTFRVYFVIGYSATLLMIKEIRLILSIAAPVFAPLKLCSVIFWCFFFIDKMVIKSCVTHCKGQSFWKRTGRRTSQSPWRRSSARPRRPSPGCPRRSPDKPSRRRQTASSSRGGRGEQIKGGVLFKQTLQSPLIEERGHWGRRAAAVDVCLLHTIITSAICFHCSCVGSVPVGL